jgi:hypothetical protein
MQSSQLHNHVTKPQTSLDHIRTEHKVGRPMPPGFLFISTSLAHAIPVLGGLVAQGHGQSGAVYPRGEGAATAPVLLVVPRSAVGV